MGLIALLVREVCALSQAFGSHMDKAEGRIGPVAPWDFGSSGLSTGPDPGLT
ncbi:hypothetical protein FH972_015420 [Carpinus fangiana]|uniref:Chlorophyll a-b binding protein, chloroplastic n=1 Tax=Carpinus fangiana TaxID=176857 RepID=A0A5N6RCN2_9ROSI|nr:hypothetical protein FH972_015420 [Carpinus fangiana]